MEMFDEICEKYQYNILHRTHHQFDPQGITILYMLSESHLSIHTFPEKNYAALDLYTCREYPSNDVYLDIQEYLKKMFESDGENFTIVERSHTSMKNVIK
jgi:S-adenosylmethionine decarboxylase proenzyme